MKKSVLGWLFIGILFFLSVQTVVRAQEDGDDGEDVQEGGAGHGAGAGGANAGAAGGDEQEEEADATATEEDKEIVLAPSRDVTTSIIFPDFPDKKIHVGEKVTVLIGFKNNGKSTFNITTVAAHLHSPFDFNYYIQNFTVREIGALVEPEREVSIEYIFAPDKSLEPLEFHLSAYVDYNSTTGEQFRTTFTNGTIELIEKPSEFDAKQFFTYISGAGVLGLLLYITLSLSGTLSKSSSSSSHRASRSSSSNKGSSDGGDSSSGSASQAGGSVEDWAGPIYTPKTKSSAIGRKSSAKKAPKSPKAGGAAAAADS